MRMFTCLSVKHLYRVLMLCAAFFLARFAANACDADLYAYQVTPWYICSPQYVTVAVDLYNANGDDLGGNIRWYTQETGGDLIASSDVFSNDHTITRTADVYATNGGTVWVCYFDYNTWCESPRVPYTFYFNAIPDVYAEYAYKCGISAKIKVNSSSAGVSYTLYVDHQDGYGPGAIETNNTGYFELSYVVPDPALTYFVTASAGGCSTPFYQLSLDGFSTDAPWATGNLSIPYGASTILSAAASDNFSSFRWYNSAGDFIFEGSPYTTPALTANTTYLLRGVNHVPNNAECITNPGSVTVQVAPLPPPPPVCDRDMYVYMTTPAILCSPGQVSLTVEMANGNGEDLGGDMLWYTQETGGDLIASAQIFSSDHTITSSAYVNATNGGTVWVCFFDYNTRCESPRVPYTFHFNPIPDVYSEYAYRCGYSAKIKVNSTSSGVSYTLYVQDQQNSYGPGAIETNNTGYFELSYVVPDPNLSYFVTASAGGCSTAYYPITLNEFSTDPPNVTGNTNLAAGTSTTLTASGDVYGFKWYDGNGNFLQLGSSYTTPVLAENVYTYQVRAITEHDICISEPNTVTVAVNLPATNYTTLYNSGNFTKTVDLSKPVGTINAVAGTNGSGAATYNIPVYTPPGTNGLAPAISVSYSSQATNGVVGYGWNVTGLSVIGRAGKDQFHDGMTTPISLTDQDAFTLNGMRLNPIVGANGANMTVYAGEVEGFSKIISHDGSTNNPGWFEVIQKDGSIMEFGHSTDSRILSDDGNNVVLWQLNKIIDINGNYILFKYVNGHRDNRIDEIVYTGNANTGLLPYNSIKFSYRVRSDVATNYVAGASFTVKHLLNSITIKNDGNLVKTYQFNYGFDNLYSLLKEVVETGSDGLSLNSTIFLYSAQQQSIQVKHTETLMGPYDYYAGDFDADGKTDLLAAELDYDQGLKFHKRLEVLSEISEGSGSAVSLYIKDLPGSYFVYGKESKLANFLSSDYDGDGRDDIMQVNVIPTTKSNKPVNYIDNIIVDFARSQDPNTGITTYASATYSWKIFPDHRIIEPTTGSFLVPGDFDGDGNKDIITILGKSNGDMVYDPSYNKYRAFIISPSAGIVNWPVSNLGIGSYSPVEDITTTIADAKIIAGDFDGDGKDEVMASNNDGSYIFSIQKTGSGSTLSFNASLLFFTAGIVKGALVYPGDFNGDGKTDLLVRNGNWKIMYSTGKGFVTNNFTFNQNVDITQSYADDKLIVSDFNGDGKSDILHGYQDGSSTSKFSLYYSVGNITNSFQYEQYDYQGVLAFENGHGFVVGDFDGDGKSDLLNRPSVGSVADFISFKPLGKERLLEKVTDGHDVTYEFKYKLLTDKNDYPYFYERTVELEDPANHNPFYYVQMPVFAVSDFISPNGLSNGKDITSYNYKDAVIHRGKGFLGFKTVVSQNNLTGITTETKNEINTDFAVPFTVRQTNELTASGDKLSEQINKVSFVGLSAGTTDPKRFVQQLERSVQIDHLTGSASQTDNSFDSYANVTTATVKTGTPVYNASDPLQTTVNPIESVTTTTTYGTFNTPFPARPVSVTVNNERTGMPNLSRVTDYTYTTNGLTATKTDFVGLPKAVTSTFTYDQFGNAVTATVSATGLNSRQTTNTYDTKGRLPISKQQTGSAITQTETFTYDFKWGKVLTQTSPDCLTSTFEYDGFGRLTKTTLPAGFSVSASMNWDIQGEIVYYTFTDYPGGTPDVKTWYDKLGRERKKQTAGFNNKWLTTLTTYDARGNVQTKTEPYYATETPLQTTFVYDQFNRLESGTNGIGQVDYSYSNLGGGNLELTVSAGGQQTTKTTDATNKVVSATDKGGKLEYTYDSWGNQMQVKHGGTVILQNVYDSYGRQTSVTDKNAGVMTYVYDAFGQLTQQTDNSNNTYAMAYDDFGRIISRQGPEGITLYEYYKDPVTGCNNNSISKVSGINGIMKEFTYDYLKRLQTEKTTINGTLYTTQYDYDTYGQITKITYPSGVAVNKVYDNSGNLLTVTGGDNGAPTTLFTATGMNGHGQYTGYTLGNNRSTQNSYTYGYPTRYYTPGIQDLNFNFDYAKANLLSRQDAIKNLTETFGYDDLNRLTSTTVNGVPQLNIGFDNNGSVSMGNITSKTDAGDYVYNSNKINQVAYITNPAGPTVPPANMSTVDQLITYTAFQKTATITEGNYQLEYVYGADYQRAVSILKQNNAIIETKYYLGDYEIQVSNGVTREIHYVKGGNGLCAIIEREGGVNNFQFVYTDYLGSILTLTDLNGNVTAEQSFDAWGRNRNPLNWQYGTVPPVPVWLYRGYTSHEHLKQFALINMNGRMYDPVQGRMLSTDNYVADVFGTQNYNRYSYALNNPLAYVDPDGNNPAIIVAAIVGAYMGGLIANNGQENPFKWDYESTQTWTYMLGGAAIAAGGAYLGAYVATQVAATTAFPMPGLLGAISGSFVSSAAMNILTNGASPVSISFAVGSLQLQSGELTVGYGPVDYNISYGRFEYLGKRGNSPAENISFGIQTAQAIWGHKKDLFLTDDKKTTMGKIWQIASRFTWELPQTLLGMAVNDLYAVPGVHKAEEHEEHKGVSFFKAKGLHGQAGATLGNQSVIGPNANRPHEWGHSIQSKILGPLYLPAAAIPSLFRATFDFLWPRGTYLDFYTEKWADNLGNNYNK